MTIRAAIFWDIEVERSRQDGKWGGPEHDDEHRPADWCHYIYDHNQRALIAERDDDPWGYRYQLVRVAALAVAALESNDRLAARDGVDPPSRREPERFRWVRIKDQLPPSRRRVLFFDVEQFTGYVESFADEINHPDIRDDAGMPRNTGGGVTHWRALSSDPGDVE